MSYVVVFISVVVIEYLLEKIAPFGYTDNFTWTDLVSHCTVANL